MASTLDMQHGTVLPDLLFWEGTRLKRVGIVQGGFSVGPHC